LFAAYSNEKGQRIVDRTYRNQVEEMVNLGLIVSQGTGRWRVYSVSS
jgi:hypothetical protein